MDMNWFQMLIIWHIYIFVLGLIFFPITSIIFRKFIDKGYPFARTIGIIILSYTTFLLGVLRIVPFTQESLFFLLVIMTFFIYYFKKDHVLKLIRTLSFNQWMLLLGEELFFLVSLISLFLVRSQEPSIHGLEKFMDYGFMQSIGRSRYFPPLDMWLSADPQSPNGYPINYYYFGHLSGAMLTKLTGIPSSISYNLILATIFAQGMTLAFSWCLNACALFYRYTDKNLPKIRTIATGLIGSVLVNLAGNLHMIYLFTKGYENEKPVPFWTIWQDMDATAQQAIESNMNFFSTLIQNAKYWYPNATRFIPYTIHEFPSYSYVVADLHGHVFDIPFVLTTLAFILAYISRKHIPTHPNQKNLLSYKKLFIDLVDARWTILFGAMVAVHYMTNAFDGPIYILLVMILLAYRFRLTLTFGLHVILLGISYMIFSLPFSAFFTPFVSGIGVNCSPSFLVELKKIGPFLFEKGNCQVSEWWMLFVLWGFFLICFILFLSLLYLQKENKKAFNKIDALVSIIFLFGFFLIAIPEFFYIKDIYPAHFRANTMFKMGYQAYIMMSMASAYVIMRIVDWKNYKKYIWASIYTLPFLLVSVYFYFAFPSYYPGIDKITQTYFPFLTDQKMPKITPQLDGIAWLKDTYQQDLEIINYINKNIIGQPVILEAQGDSYTDYNRVSAYTGIPTVAGWWVHEWLWRGSSDTVGNRIPDISSMYESTDLEITRNLFKKYNVEYVVISQMEREKYPKINEEKFSKIGTLIFQSTNGVGALYKVN